MHVLIASPFADEATKWVVIGLAVVTILYAVMRPAMRRKDPMSKLNKGEAFSSLAQQRSAERDMSNLLVEMSEMARQITGQLDTRAAKLEMLIQEADEKIRQLQQLGSGNGSGAAREGRDEAVGGGSMVVRPQASPALPGATVQELAPPQSPQTAARYGEIYALADEGHTAQEIAHQLGRPNGEVQLILALRPRS